ncbi:MAG: hypothetical protein QOH81_2376 [Sphingomonadales bacterium]|jgi:hypothetical protein|nr:hypothetical protein [Sphingomonadales bacterium]
MAKLDREPIGRPKVRKASRAFAVALASAATPAAAADRPTPAALQMTYDMAACMVKHLPARSRRVLAYVPGSEEAFQAFFAANPADCLSEGDVALKLKGPFPRGAIAELLLLRDFSAIGVPKAAKISPVFATPDTASLARLKPRAKQELASLAVAECVVRTEPQKSFALFGTRIGSPEEKADIEALIPALGRCVPATAGVDMEMAALRAYLGEAAYRVSFTLSQRVSG